MEWDDYLMRLQTLFIYKLPQLVSLPHGLKGFANTKQFLHIYDCENLGVLPEWLPNLSSSQILEILECPKLSFLPKGIDRLTALRELKINGCPELRRDYEQEVGKYWGRMGLNVNTSMMMSKQQRRTLELAIKVFVEDSSKEKGFLCLKFLFQIGSHIKCCFEHHR
ncbi:putative disease resistance protein rga4 [Quercus suber]|uniref:Disease resistance protein rga4 n=1 Tax=Quercus suber TaxID=58331 RepID=A0AAW0L2R9_QUESU